MKKTFALLLFSFLINCSYGQEASLVGGWYWRDDVTKSVLIFKSDGSVSITSGPLNTGTDKVTIKKGTYKFKSNLLTIIWDNNSMENNKVKFLDTNKILLTNIDKKNKKLNPDYLFSRIIDEEVNVDDR